MPLLLLALFLTAAAAVTGVSLWAGRGSGEGTALSPFLVVVVFFLPLLLCMVPPHLFAGTLGVFRSQEKKKNLSCMCLCACASLWLTLFF